MQQIQIYDRTIRVHIKSERHCEYLLTIVLQTRHVCDQHFSNLKHVTITFLHCNLLRNIAKEDMFGIDVTIPEPKDLRS